MLHCAMDYDAPCAYVASQHHLLRSNSMASYSQTQTRTVGRVLSDAVQSVTSSLRVRTERARQRRQIANELAMYTDRELQELGFSRSDIPSIAAGSYRR
jgi:uncharacterized protein YjiS (DUF1127 family)